MALTSYDEALSQVIADGAARALASELVAVADAYGRVLAEAVRAPIAVPGFANSAMDGYAVRAGCNGVAAGQKFRCTDLALAGAVNASRDAPAEDVAIEIATGAALPDGADTIMQYEATTRDGDWVTATHTIAPGAHVRAADDDYACDALALPAGRVLDAGALGVLASFGLSHISVRRRPRVAVIVTGSELVAAGVTLARGQIHDSNSETLRALLAPFAESLTMCGPVVDDIDVLRESLRGAAASHDVVITAGGASAGRADFIPTLVRELGELRLWKIATRPGMPYLHGVIGDAAVHGLPGNPVSVFASVLTLVLPALRAMQGMPEVACSCAMLLGPVRKSHARLEWRRGWVSTAGDGRRVIAAHNMTGSGMLRGVAESNALFRIDPATRQLGAGAIVEVLPFPA